jgi:hypothetical protein
MSWQQLFNNSMIGQLTPVLRVSWSQPRCWNGDTVTILIRSSYIKDGGLIDLAINAVGHPAPVDTVLGLVINGNSLDHAYVVDWKNKVVPVNSIQFEVTATLRVPNVVSAASDPLSVDLLVPVFSA